MVTYNNVPQVFNGMKRFVLHPAGQRQKDLLSLVLDYQNGRIRNPLHQRPVVWKPSQHREWAKTLIANSQSANLSFGVFMTYQIPEDPDIFLNDGWNRLNSTIHFLDNFAVYKIESLEIAKSIVQAFIVTVHHAHFESHQTALYWFQKVQMGSPLTAYDFCKGILDYIDPKTNWRSFLDDDLFGAFSNLFARFSINRHAGNRPPSEKVSMDKYKRLSYSTFYYWITRRIYSAQPYSNPATNVLDLDSVERGKVVEMQLGNELVKFGYATVLTEFKAFQNFLEQVSLIIDLKCVEVFGKPSQQYITPGLFYALLNMAVLARNNSKNLEVFGDFVVLVLSSSQRGTTKLCFADDFVKAVAIGDFQDILNFLRQKDFAPYKNIPQSPSKKAIG